MKTRIFTLVLFFLSILGTNLKAQNDVVWSKTIIPTISVKAMTIASRSGNSYNQYNTLFALSNDNKLYRLIIDYNMPFNDKESKQSMMLDSSIEYTTITAIDSIVLIGTKKHGLYRSSDLGETWLNITDSISNLEITCFNLKKGQPSTMYCGTENGEYVSRDLGLHWSKLTNELKDKKIITLYNVSDNTYEPALYSSTSDSNLYKSGDGETWINFKIPGLSDNLIKYFCYSPFDIRYPVKVYSASDKKIYFTTEGLEPWTDLIPDAPSNNISGIFNYYTAQTSLKYFKNNQNKYIPFDHELLIIGTEDKGVWIAPMESKEDWFEINNGLADTNVNCITTTQNDIGNFVLFAGTKSDGVYKTIIQLHFSYEVSFDSRDSSISIISSSSNLLRVIFNLSDYSAVNLEMYDMLGNKAGNDYNLPYANGNQFLDIDISSLQSGLYLLKLQTKDKVVIRKVLITR